MKKKTTTTFEFDLNILPMPYIVMYEGYFVPSLVEISQVVMKKKMKMWKVNDHNDKPYEDDGQRTNFCFVFVYFVLKYLHANKKLQPQTHTDIHTYWCLRPDEYKSATKIFKTLRYTYV